MAKFTLSIELGNDAMVTLADVAESLRDTATRIDFVDSHPSIHQWGSVLDANGNKVGQWKVE